MSKFNIVSEEYTSNCMIEAIKAKLKNPNRVKIYFCKPVLNKGHFQNRHFMWSDGEKDYDFSDLEDNPLPLYRTFVFKGVIRQFELGFAKSYSEYRNRRGHK